MIFPPPFCIITLIQLFSLQPLLSLKCKPQFRQYLDSLLQRTHLLSRLKGSQIICGFRYCRKSAIVFACQVNQADHFMVPQLQHILQIQHCVCTEIPVSKFFTVEAVSVSLNILDVMKKSVKRKMSQELHLTICCWQDRWNCSLHG